MVREPPPSTKQSAVRGIIGIPAGDHCVIKGRLNAHPARTSAPRIATVLPAIRGTRSKKSISGLWRAAGLVVTWVGVDMLLVARKPIRESASVQFYQVVFSLLGAR